MKDVFVMKRAIFLFFMLIILLAGCYKQKAPALSYNESTGYNLYQMLGYSQEDVLKQMIKQGIEPDLEIDNDERQVYTFRSNLFDYSKENAYLIFQKQGNDLMLYQYGIQVILNEKWPSEEDQVSDALIKVYKALKKAYGEPSELSPAMGEEPSAIMNGTAYKYACWINEEKNLRIDFFLQPGDNNSQFRGGFCYSDLSIYKQFNPIE